MKKVFGSIDAAQAGVLTYGQLLGFFQAQNFDEVRFKKLTKQQLFDNIMECFGVSEQKPISLADWVKVYRNIGYASIT